MKANASGVTYLFILLTYFSVPLVHDIIPYHADFLLDDWLALLGMYIVGGIVALPLLLLAFKTDFHPNSGELSFYIRAFISLLLLGACVWFFWDNSKALYISLPLLMIVVFCIMSVGRGNPFKSSIVLRDKKSCDIYQVKNRVARELRGDKTNDYASKEHEGNIPPGAIHPASAVPMSGGLSGFVVGGNSWDNSNCEPAITVNPATGLPMNGGMSGVDVGGNSWGTSFNDPSASHNTYDPNRGY